MGLIALERNANTKTMMHAITKVPTCYVEQLNRAKITQQRQSCSGSANKEYGLSLS